MIEGFDKEMDFLLRRAAKGESAQTFDAHPDADEISLFAENALTAKARERAAVHLAECTKCRKILSNVILFNAESESETIHAAEAESKLIPAAAAPLIPWYRRLFAFPQITFAMGALVLVFSGVIAFLVLQNSSDIEQNATVARNEEFTEKSRGTGGASSDGETETIETYSANSSNAASANPSLMSNSNATSTANTVANSMNASADSFSGNVAAPALRQSPQAVAKNESANEIARPENSLPADARRNGAVPVAPPQQQNQTVTTTGAPSSSLPKDNNRQAESQAAKENSETKLAERSRNNELRRADENTTLPKPAAKKSAALGADDKNKAGGERALGGKTFRNVGGIWFDSGYNRQRQIMIRRGSDDYKRLDSGLRSIAENLGGTVIVVWKSKAYRIH